MRKYYQQVLALFVLAFTTSQATEQWGFALEGSPEWEGEYTYQITCQDTRTKQIMKVPFVCEDKIPVSYILMSGEKFPQLNLKDALSCQNYVESVSDYCKSLRFARREYAYYTTIGDIVLKDHRMPLSQVRLACTFHSMKLEPNFDFQQLELVSFKVCVSVNGNSIPMDVTSKIKERFGRVGIPLMGIEGDSQMDSIVSTRGDMTGRVYDANGSVQVFHLPAILGVDGFEDKRDVRIVTYRKGATPYENALASWIKPAQVEKKILQPLELVSSQTTSSNYSSLSSSSSMDEGRLESENWRTDEPILDRYFQLSEEPECLVSSPYVYNDGRKLYLTQTVKQHCWSYVNGVADKESSWVLTYTILTPYPVEAPGFTPSSKASGLYQWEKSDDQSEKGFWLKLDSTYEVQDMFTAQPQKFHGLLTQAVRSQLETDDLKTVWTLAGLDDYVELEGQEKYQWLVNRFQSNTEDLSTVIESLSEKEAHIIPTFLLTIRHRDDLADSKLMGPMAYNKYENGNKCKWNSEYGYSSHQHLSLKQKLQIFTLIYPFTCASLRLLPLLTTTEQAWNKRSMSLIIGGEIPSESYGLGKKFYRYIAQYLGLDGLIGFSIYSQWDYESDREITIQELAHCLRHLKKLKSLTLTWFMGVKNMEHLIEHGLCQNHSIERLSFSNFYGNYPFVLIGRLLSKNTTIKKLSISAQITDYESLNELGRGLLMNKILEELYLKDCSNGGYPDNEQNHSNDWIEQPGNSRFDELNFKSIIGGRYRRYEVRRPLPGREQRGSNTSDFSVLEQAIRKSNLKYIYANHGPYNSPEHTALFNMLERVKDKPGLVVKIN